MNRIIKTLSAIAFIFGSIQVNAQTTNYQVHSLFVINIAKYSTWPNHEDEFVITVFGKSKIFDELTKHAAGKTINGQHIKVTQTVNLVELGKPNIVYLADGKSSALDDLLKATEGKSIMVIAEREGLYKKGAGFSFVILDDHTLRYDLNNSEMERRQIRVSKNLTSLANTVL